MNNNLRKILVTQVMDPMRPKIEKKWVEKKSFEVAVNIGTLKIQ